MEKLTLQDCFKYPNARIINKDKDIIVYSGIYYWIWASVLGTMNISDCKLILRPLKNSLVQAEKDYLLKTFLKPNDYDFDCLFFDEIEESIAFLLDILPFNMVAKLIDYLRSINIDIDGLQERGVAVYE
jgi:hypothetical protein